MTTNIDKEIEETRKKLEELEAAKKLAAEQASSFQPSRESLAKLKVMVENEELKVLKDGSEWAEFGYDEGSYVEIGDWKVTLKERFGGYEGLGEEHYLVYEVSQNGALHSYWKVPGWYQSYNGAETEWENIHQVKPVEKMIIVWDAA
jgi:hypothetical protein